VSVLDPFPVLSVLKFGVREKQQGEDRTVEGDRCVSLLPKLAQHLRGVEASAFRRRQSRPQPLENL
jgi:hypothetical protein